LQAFKYKKEDAGGCGKKKRFGLLAAARDNAMECKHLRAQAQTRAFA
jgi:hypothetical protein